MHPAALGTDNFWALIGKELSCDEWATLAARIEWVYSKHRAALGTNSFWAAIDDEKWEDTFKPRIEWVYSKHPPALSKDCLWAKIFVDPSQWGTIKNESTRSSPSIPPPSN